MAIHNLRILVTILGQSHHGQQGENLGRPHRGGGGRSDTQGGTWGSDQMIS